MCNQLRPSAAKMTARICQLPRHQSIQPEHVRLADPSSTTVYIQAIEKYPKRKGIQLWRQEDLGEAEIKYRK